jgi:amino acid transporter
VLFVIAASPIILAMAGYVFNEVFLHWFPNLGFSFCLLGVLLLLNLAGDGVARTAQVLLVLAAVICLLILSFAGLTSLPVSESLKIPAAATGRLPQILLAGLLLFVGFELPALAAGRSPQKPGGMLRAMILAILFSAVLFALWGLASSGHVLPEKLSQTTVPHRVAASAILGENGRLLMGIGVLAASAAAVNALFVAIAATISQMADEGFAPSFLGRRWGRPLLPLLLLSGGTAAMMAGGMAGEPVTEVYIRAAFFFWVLYYGAARFSALRLRQKETGRVPVATLLGIAALLAALVVLIGYDPARPALFKAILTVFLPVVLYSLLWGSSRKRSKRGETIQA